MDFNSSSPLRGSTSTLVVWSGLIRFTFHILFYAFKYCYVSILFIFVYVHCCKGIFMMTIENFVQNCLFMPHSGNVIFALFWLIASWTHWLCLVMSVRSCFPRKFFLETDFIFLWFLHQSSLSQKKWQSPIKDYLAQVLVFSALFALI